MRLCTYFIYQSNIRQCRNSVIEFNPSYFLNIRMCVVKVAVLILINTVCEESKYDVLLIFKGILTLTLSERHKLII